LAQARAAGQVAFLALRLIVAARSASSGGDGRVGDCVDDVAVVQQGAGNVVHGDTIAAFRCETLSMSRAALAALYDDGLVKLDEHALTLRRYYFPVAIRKRIPYADIRGVEQRSMGKSTGKLRFWGSGDFRHWTPLDVNRAGKDVAIVLDLGKRVQPVFSPDDPERVAALLRRYAPGASC
jgi:hypothetical protein